MNPLDVYDTPAPTSIPATLSLPVPEQTSDIDRAVARNDTATLGAWCAALLARVEELEPLEEARYHSERALEDFVDDLDSLSADASLAVISDACAAPPSDDAAAVSNVFLTLIKGRDEAHAAAQRASTDFITSLLENADDRATLGDVDDVCTDAPNDDIASAATKFLVAIKIRDEKHATEVKALQEKLDAIEAATSPLPMDPSTSTLEAQIKALAEENCDLWRRLADEAEDQHTARAVAKVRMTSTDETIDRLLDDLHAASARIQELEVAVAEMADLRKAVEGKTAMLQGAMEHSKTLRDRNVDTATALAQLLTDLSVLQDEALAREVLTTLLAALKGA